MQHKRTYFSTALVVLYAALSGCNSVPPESPENRAKVENKDNSKQDTPNSGSQTAHSDVPPTTVPKDGKIEDFAENDLLLNGPQELAVSEEVSYSVRPSDALVIRQISVTHLVVTAEPANMVTINTSGEQLKLTAVSTGIVKITVAGKANGRGFKFSKSFDIVRPKATEIVVDTEKSITVGNCSAIVIAPRKGATFARFAQQMEATLTGADFSFFSDSQCQTAMQKESLEGLFSKIYYLRTEKAVTRPIKVEVTGLPPVESQVTASADGASTAQNISLNTVAGTCLAVPFSLKDKFGNSIDVVPSRSTLRFESSAADISGGRDADLYSDSACQHMAGPPEGVSPDAIPSQAKLTIEANNAPTFYIKARRAMTYPLNIALTSDVYNINFSLNLDVRPAAPRMVRMYENFLRGLFANECGEIEIRMYDEYSNASPVSADLTIPLITTSQDSPSPSISLFKDAACTEASGSPVVGVGESSKRLYVGARHPSPAIRTYYDNFLVIPYNQISLLGLKFDWLVVASQDLKISIRTYERPDRLVVSGPSVPVIGMCLSYPVGPGLLLSGSNARTLYDRETNPIDVNLRLTNGDAVFSDNTCTTSISKFTLSKWNAERNVYVKIRAGETQLIAEATNGWSTLQTITGESGGPYSLLVTGPDSKIGSIAGVYGSLCVGPYFAHLKDYSDNDAVTPTFLTVTLRTNMFQEYFTNDTCTSAPKTSVDIPSGTGVTMQGLYRKMSYGGQLPASVGGVVSFETSVIFGGTTRNLSGSGSIMLLKP